MGDFVMHEKTFGYNRLSLQPTLGGDVTTTAVMGVCCGDAIFLAESVIGLCLILLVDDRVAAK